jgi:Actinobacteria/chloroflexi VLRF1 release factor
MARTRSAAGGGVVVEVGIDRLAGWVTRFGGRNSGLLDMTATPDRILLRAGDGTTADIAVPFGAMSIGSREPLESLITHLRSLGAVGIIAVRAGAHSVGIARAGVVVASKTDRPYVQGRTAAGGWSQQRYARRRGNQLTASLDDAASAAARVLLPATGSLDALILGGDITALRTVLDDPRLVALKALPVREFRDIPEPRRSVIDDLAERMFTVEITVRPR